MIFNSIVSLCERHGFLRTIPYAKLNFSELKIGPTGHLLLHNLQNEWFYSAVINKDVSVFPCQNDALEYGFDFVKAKCLETLPFGVAQVLENTTKKDMEAYYIQKANSNETDYAKMFQPEDCQSLKCTVFASSKDAVSFFHQWQRQRRIWWRKFSPNPGRYALTDIKTDENNNESVEIVAKYPWNSQLVEKLTLFTSQQALPEHKLKFKDGKKTVTAHSIVSEIDLNTLFLNTLCDAYDEPDYKGTNRTLLRFHRKLAPYSVSVAIPSLNTAVVASELKDLAMYITRQLRTLHVSTYFLPSSVKLSLDAQVKQYDELGIPYTIILNEGTLKNGVSFLRSRDTTLKEQVHVSDLVNYVQQLFKNY